MKSGESFVRIAKRLKAAEQKYTVPADESVEDFIVRISPKLEKPHHLGRALELFNESRNAPIRMLLSVPPRHCKSYTIMHLVAQIMCQDPTKRVAYITHTENLALEHSRLIKEFAEQGGLEVSDKVRAADFWKTKAGGSLQACGVGGPIMGRGYDFIVFDDPYKSRAQVESLLERTRVQSFFDSAVASRIQPGSRGSIIICHTRYHCEDLIGTLVAREADLTPDLRAGWEYVNLPAINEDGEALWPKYWPVNELLKKKAANEFEWASMYQGQPVPHGGAIFNDVTYYSAEDLAAVKKTAKRFQVAIGIDCAYTSKSYSDYSVAITGFAVNDSLYIDDVTRMQSDVNTFGTKLKQIRNKWGNCSIFWFLSGIEKPVLLVLQNMGIYVRHEVAAQNKVSRAQGVATYWNTGRVLLPDNDPPWMAAFLNEVLSFGAGSKHDDQVDALAALHYTLFGKPYIIGEGASRIVPF